MFPLVAEQPFLVLRHLMMLAGVRWLTFGIESEVLAAQNAHLQLVDQDDDDEVVIVVAEADGPDSLHLQVLDTCRGVHSCSPFLEWQQSPSSIRIRVTTFQ